VQAVRGLVEDTTLPQGEIAARVGVCRETVSNLRVRHGWRRPGAARLRGQCGGDNPVLTEAVAAARPLVDGTALSVTAIAKRLGVSRSSVTRWRVHYGWQRPPDAPTSEPPPRADGRARPARYRTVKGRPYAADAVERARDLLTGTVLSQVAIARQLGVTHAWVGNLLRRRGWERPPAPRRSRRFWANRRTGPLAVEGDRRGLPYAPEVRREARAMWELTLLPTASIAARLNIQPRSVNRWAQQEGWERPRGRRGGRQMRGYFAMLRQRR
jgi:DNA invertase Pin-like site-specific DNA recombinase